MDSKTVFAKTEKGKEEIATRKHGLALSLRRVLILVNGESNIKKIMEKGEGLPDIATSIDALVKEGYIHTSSSNAGRDIKDDLIDIARKILGNDAGKVIKKIEKSPVTAEGLRVTIDECKKLVKFVIDEKKAEELSKRCLDVIKKN